MADTTAHLRAAGAQVDLLYPDEEVLEPAAVRPRHDLYVLKSGSAMALELAAALDAAGAALINPYPLAALASDKVRTTRALAAAGVPTPRSWCVLDGRRAEPLLVHGALVVKPARGSGGRGVTVARTAADLAGMAHRDGPYLVQRHHPPDGPDHKLYRIGAEVHGVRRVWPPLTDADDRGEPFGVDGELLDIALRAGDALGASLYGLDVVVSGGRPYVVDFASFPGFRGVPEAGRRLAEHILARSPAPSS